MIEKKTRLYGYILGILCFACVCWFQLGMGTFFKRNLMMGDFGDGYFNLWVLEKTYQKISNLNFENFLSGNIFFPQIENTLFWSDNHLVYAPAYGLLRSLGCTQIFSFGLLSYFLSFIGYVINFFFFHTIFQAARERLSGLTKKSYLFVPFFALLAHYSESKIRYFMHWQNLSYFWVLAIVSACISISFRSVSISRKTHLFSSVAIFQTVLILASPYFAVLASILIATWAIPFFYWQKKVFIELVKKSFWIVIPCICICGLIAAIYARNENIEYSLSHVHFYSARWWHFFMPRAGLAREILSLGPWKLAMPSHESCAYLGFGLIIMLFFLIVCGSQKVSLGLIKKIFYSNWTKIGLGVLATLAIVNKVHPPSYAVLLATGIALVLAKVFVKPYTFSKQSLSGPFYFILGTWLVCFGLSIGPLGVKWVEPISPSIWGVFKFFVPPLGSMRAIGRLAGLSQTFSLGLCFLFFLRQIACKNQVRWVCLSIAFVALQAIDPIGVRPRLSSVDRSVIDPSPEAAGFFSTINGPGLVLPSFPFHENATTMLYFAQIPHLDLLNGYSAKSTSEWDKLMYLGENNGEPNEDQIVQAQLLGATWLAFFKRRMTASPSEIQKNVHLPVLFDSPDIEVFSLKEDKFDSLPIGGQLESKPR